MDCFICVEWLLPLFLFGYSEEGETLRVYDYWKGSMASVTVESVGDLRKPLASIGAFCEACFFHLYAATDTHQILLSDTARGKFDIHFSSLVSCLSSSISSTWKSLNHLCSQTNCQLESLGHVFLFSLCSTQCNWLTIIKEKANIAISLLETPTDDDTWFITALWFSPKSIPLEKLTLTFGSILLPIDWVALTDRAPSVTNGSPSVAPTPSPRRVCLPTNNTSSPISTQHCQ